MFHRRLDAMTDFGFMETVEVSLSVSSREPKPGFADHVLGVEAESLSPTIQGPPSEPEERFVKLSLILEWSIAGGHDAYPVDDAYPIGVWNPWVFCCSEW